MGAYFVRARPRHIWTSLNPIWHVLEPIRTNILTRKESSEKRKNNTEQNGNTTTATVSWGQDKEPKACFLLNRHTGVRVLVAGLVRSYLTHCAVYLAPPLPQPRVRAEWLL